MRIRLLASTITALTLCAIAGTQAYVLNGPKWGTSQVPYYTNPANLDVSESAATAAVQAGLATWGSQSNANFSFYYMGRTSGTTLAYNGKNEIFFRNASAGSTVAETHWWYDTATNRLLDADIVFWDGGITFFTGSSGCSGGVYIEDVAAHESGHALGLGHSAVSTATMYPTMGWCSTVGGRTLDPDDLAAVEKLYPPAGGGTTTNTAPTVSITSPATNSSFPAGTAIKFTGAASDREDGALSASIVWTSSINGQLGVGSSISAALSSGTHTITAKTTDRAGATATAQVVVIVAPAIQPPPPPPATNATAAKSDFSNDGKADIIWQRDDGYLAVWTMNGASMMTSPSLNPGRVSDPNWRIAATGDLNGDGRPDLVWQHVTAGWLSVWFMNGGSLIRDDLLVPNRILSNEWRIVASADMNGDGKSDLIWQHTAGWLAVWYMNGEIVTSDALLTPAQISGNDWKIVGAGDFNGDGKPDLVWQHTTGGWLCVWLMNGSTMQSAVYLNPAQVTDQSWHLRGVIDLNGDGQTDLLWQHDSGYVGAWFMNGTTQSNAVLLNPSSVSGGWQIMGPR
jgi:hypothetical protein